MHTLLPHMIKKKKKITGSSTGLVKHAVLVQFEILGQHGCRGVMHLTSVFLEILNGNRSGFLPAI
jgi:hypothetical protein